MFDSVLLPSILAANWQQQLSVADNSLLRDRTRCMHAFLNALPRRKSVTIANCSRQRKIKQTKNKLEPRHAIETGRMPPPEKCIWSTTLQ